MINFARLNEDVEKEFVSGQSSGTMSKFIPEVGFRDTLSSLKESFLSYDRNLESRSVKISTFNQEYNMKSSFYQHISNTVGESSNDSFKKSESGMLYGMMNAAKYLTGYANGDEEDLPPLSKKE